MMFSNNTALFAAGNKVVRRKKPNQSDQSSQSPSVLSSQNTSRQGSVSPSPSRTRQQSRAQSADRRSPHQRGTSASRNNDSQRDESTIQQLSWGESTLTVQLRGRDGSPPSGSDFFVHTTSLSPSRTEKVKKIIPKKALEERANSMASNSNTDVSHQLERWEDVARETTVVRTTTFGFDPLCSQQLSTTTATAAAERNSQTHLAASQTHAQSAELIEEQREFHEVQEALKKKINNTTLTTLRDVAEARTAIVDDGVSATLFVEDEEDLELVKALPPVRLQCTQQQNTTAGDGNEKRNMDDDCSDEDEGDDGSYCMGGAEKVQVVIPPSPVVEHQRQGVNSDNPHASACVASSSSKASSVVVDVLLRSVDPKSHNKCSALKMRKIHGKKSGTSSSASLTEVHQGGVVRQLDMDDDDDLDKSELLALQEEGVTRLCNAVAANLSQGNAGAGVSTIGSSDDTSSSITAELVHNILDGDIASRENSPEPANLFAEIKRMKKRSTRDPHHQSSSPSGHTEPQHCLPQLAVAPDESRLTSTSGAIIVGGEELLLGGGSKDKKNSSNRYRRSRDSSPSKKDESPVRTRPTNSSSGVLTSVVGSVVNNADNTESEWVTSLCFGKKKKPLGEASPLPVAQKPSSTSKRVAWGGEKAPAAAVAIPVAAAAASPLPVTASSANHVDPMHEELPTHDGAATRVAQEHNKDNNDAGAEEPVVLVSTAKVAMVSVDPPKMPEHLPSGTDEAAATTTGEDDDTLGAQNQKENTTRSTVWEGRKSSSTFGSRSRSPLGRNSPLKRRQYINVTPPHGVDAPVPSKYDLAASQAAASSAAHQGRRPAGLMRSRPLMAPMNSPPRQRGAGGREAIHQFINDVETMITGLTNTGKLKGAQEVQEAPRSATRFSQPGLKTVSPAPAATTMAAHTTTTSEPNPRPPHTTIYSAHGPSPGGATVSTGGGPGGSRLRSPVPTVTIMHPTFK